MDVRWLYKRGGEDEGEAGIWEEEGYFTQWKEGRNKRANTMMRKARN